jgi:hypothetical protein
MDYSNSKFVWMKYFGARVRSLVGDINFENFGLIYKKYVQQYHFMCYTRNHEMHTWCTANEI